MKRCNLSTSFDDNTSNSNKFNCSLVTLSKTSSNTHVLMQFTLTLCKRVNGINTENSLDDNKKQRKDVIDA